MMSSAIVFRVLMMMGQIPPTKTVVVYVVESGGIWTRVFVVGGFNYR